MPAPRPQALQLDSRATYILAGGLDALGSNNASWVIECGAKNLVFLSRSGRSKHAEVLQKFTEPSVRAEAFKCDIKDAISVTTIFESLKSSGKKIAFRCHAIGPKTKGSRILPANIWPGENPFVILLSSNTGVIGNTQHKLTVLLETSRVARPADEPRRARSGDASGHARLKRGLTNGRSVPAQVILSLGDRIEHDESTGSFSRDMNFELRAVKVRNQVREGQAKQDFGIFLSNATIMADARGITAENIKELVAAAMGVSLEEVDLQKHLMTMVVLTVKIRNRALKILRSDISVFDIFSAMPLADVAARIASKSQLVKVTASEEG
ncbi:hypothetical protein G7046_g4674 [Stylonectria norvegica]|nr:hypothetical protein G7046_g4674 [Stylonectria norvegica]